MACQVKVLQRGKKKEEAAMGSHGHVKHYLMHIAQALRQRYNYCLGRGLFWSSM